MIVGIFGQTGTGKTTLLKRIVGEAPRVLLVDPLGKLGHLGVCVDSVDEMKDYWLRQFDGRWKIVLQPGRLDPELEPTDALLPYLQVAFEVASRGCPHFTAVVDEVDRLGSPSRPDKRVRQVADYGRNHGFSLVYVARRPQCVDATLRSQSDTLYLLRITRPDDVAEFKGIVPASVVKSLPTLPDLQAWCCRLGQEPQLVAAASIDLSSFPSAAQAPASQHVSLAEPIDSPSEAQGQGRVCVVTLKEAAAACGFADANEFRRSVVDTGRIWSERISRCRWRFRSRDLAR